MKRILLSTVLILTVVLTSCGTFEVTLEDPSNPPPTLASDSSETGPASLTMDSTSEQIRLTLSQSPFRWRTLFMDATVQENDSAARRVQTWVDQPALSFRTLSGPQDGVAQTFRAADGMSLLDVDILTGASSIAPFLGQSLSIPYTPQPFSSSPGTAVPHPLASYLDSAMGAMLFPSDVAQNEGFFKSYGMEVVAYRLCLIVEWTYAKNQLPSYRAWVDISTGVFLRYQQFEKSGGSEVLMDVTATRVDYDLAFNPDLFRPVVTAFPAYSTNPLTAAYVNDLAGPPLTDDPLGTVYAFVASASSPVRETRLVQLPASCVVGQSDCPAAQTIEMPVALTASLQPLVWSPVRREAAWAYPITDDQRLWTLYIFNPHDNSWSELASFDRYMDPPMWSRDGTWLAFRLQDGKGGSEVYAIRRDGTDMKILTDSNDLPAEGWPYVMVSWLGENVVLRSDQPSQVGKVYLMRVEDQHVTPLFDMAYSKSPFLESPDGTMLTYVENSEDGRKQTVRIITPDGQTFRDMATFTSGSVLGLAWSPDGKHLAFNVRTDTVSNVYIIDSDGRNLRQVYTSATDVQFVFSPDGQYLLAQTIDGTGEHLYSIDLNSLAADLVIAPGVALNDSWIFPSWRK